MSLTGVSKGGKACRVRATISSRQSPAHVRQVGSAQSVTARCQVLRRRGRPRAPDECAASAGRRAARDRAGRRTFNRAGRNAPLSDDSGCRRFRVGNGSSSGTSRSWRTCPVLTAAKRSQCRAIRDPFEPEFVAATADVDGTFMLDVRTPKPAVAGGRYVISLDESRPAREDDRVRIEAERAVYRANLAQALRRSPEEFVNGLKDYTSALESFRRLGLRQRELRALIGVAGMQSGTQSTRAAGVRASGGAPRHRARRHCRSSAGVEPDRDIP